MMGVDLGSRRIGLAVSDPEGTVATPHSVLERSGERARDLAAVLAVAREVGGRGIVVGLPLTLAGEVGTAARKVLSEVEELRRVAGPEFTVETHDERLTTVTAGRALAEAGVRARRRRRVVDQVAASVMLQAWLDGRQ